MPQIEVEYINKFEDYVRFVLSLDRGSWFRGVGKESHELLPGLYRHPTIKDSKGLIALEAEALETFRQRSILYLEDSVTYASDEHSLSTLFLMQHYGAPTRLLDWTESPLVALFFALTYAENDKDNGTGNLTYTSDPAVWIFKPRQWNIVSSDIDSAPPVANPTDSIVHGYIVPTRPGSITIYGIHNSRRIIAQSGVFVLFGTDNSPMETVYETKDFNPGTLTKLIIPKESVASIFNELTNVGISDATIYPDLTGLSSQLKRRAGYWMS
ncbi:MAG TPA: FRG domain-containing protein [Anaerolineales bacterium]|nr:FRG domain-containing protein [Anaerolineales bacterium]HRQ91601.1 FRG domain-containing protein [Anaerolineales bacterium]